MVLCSNKIKNLTLNITLKCKTWWKHYDVGMLFSIRVRKDVEVDRAKLKAILEENLLKETKYLRRGAEIQLPAAQ